MEEMTSEASSEEEIDDRIRFFRKFKLRCVQKPKTQRFEEFLDYMKMFTDPSKESSHSPEIKSNPKSNPNYMIENTVVIENERELFKLRRSGIFDSRKKEEVEEEIVTVSDLESTFQDTEERQKSVAKSKRGSKNLFEIEKRMEQKGKAFQKKIEILCNNSFFLYSGLGRDKLIIELKGFPRGLYEKKIGKTLRKYRCPFTRLFRDDELFVETYTRKVLFWAKLPEKLEIVGLMPSFDDENTSSSMRKITVNFFPAVKSFQEWKTLIDNLH